MECRQSRPGTATERGLNSLLLLAIQLLWIVPLGMAAWNRMLGRAIAAEAPVDIAAAPLGQRMLLEGWAMPAQASPRPSTLGQIPCLWHDWRVDQDSRPADGSSSSSFPSDNHGATEEPFALENRAGDRVLILPAQASFEAVPSRTWTGPAVQIGSLSIGFGSFGLFRYTERWILAKQPLFVLGRLDPPEPGDPSGIRGRLANGGFAPFVVAGQSPEMVFEAAARKSERSFLLAGLLLPVALVATWWMWS